MLHGQGSDGSRSKIFDPGWVGSNFSCSGQVSYLWFGFGKFSLKIPNFPIFFPLDQKVTGSKAGRPLIYCWSKVCMGWVKLVPISRPGGFFYCMNAALWGVRYGGDIRTIGETFRVLILRLWGGKGILKC